MLSAKMLDFNTTKMLDFNTQGDGYLGYMGMQIPDHAQESLSNYFLNGWEPGGFLSAMLAMDMQRAISNADTANRQVMWAIGRWITENAPEGSWGDYSQIDFWCNDVAGRRSKFAEKMHKKHVWNVLAK
jgi:hypothetical protein